MAQVYSIDGTPITGRVRTTTDPSGVEGLPSSAWYGEAMIAGVTIEDPLGELDLRGWHTFTHDETDCTGSERTFTGWITGKDISRGTGRERTAAARIWDCEIIDQNAVWKLKLFRAASAQRPAETDIERMDFMRASAPMAATPVADNGRWNVTDNPISFGAASYVAQYPIDLANSVAGTSGKNFYAYWDDAAGEISGHYDLVNANPLSTIVISNVIADQDATTVYPLIDATLTRSPEDQVNGVLFQYLGNQYVYAQNAGLFGPGEFSPDNFDRDVLYSTDRVGKLETANALAASQLAARSTEQDTLTVTVLLPPDQVNLLHAGMRVASRFTHLPGYEAEGGVELAVIRRNVIPPSVRGGKYTVRLELSNAVAPTSAGGGDPGEFPPPPAVSCDPDNIVIVQSEHALLTSPAGNVAVNVAGASWPSPPTPGNLLICAWMSFSNAGDSPGSMAGWTMVGVPEGFLGFGGAGGGITIFYKIAEASEVTMPLATGGAYSSGNLSKNQNYLIEVAGVDTLDVFDQDSSEVATTTPGFTLTPSAGTTGVVFTFQEVYSQAFGFTAGHDIDAVLYVEGNILDGASPGRWIAYYVFDNASGSYDVNRDWVPTGFQEKWAQISVSFICSGSDPDAPCLEPGQPSPEDEAVTPIPDGVTATFFTRCPFADATLHVYVDNTDQTGAIASYDGAAGEFTLSFVPTPTERITVFYKGR